MHRWEGRTESWSLRSRGWGWGWPTWRRIMCQWSKSLFKPIQQTNCWNLSLRSWASWMHCFGWEMWSLWTPRLRPMLGSSFRRGDATLFHESFYPCICLPVCKNLCFVFDFIMIWDEIIPYVFLLLCAAYVKGRIGIWLMMKVCIKTRSLDLWLTSFALSYICCARKSERSSSTLLIINNQNLKCYRKGLVSQVSNQMFPLNQYRRGFLQFKAFPIARW